MCPTSGRANRPAAVAAGELDFCSAIPPAVLPLIHAGRLRALAIGSAQRSMQYPQVPTFVEAGVARFEDEPWFALALPARAPASLVARPTRACAGPSRRRPSRPCWLAAVAGPNSPRSSLRPGCVPRCRRTGVAGSVRHQGEQPTPLCAPGLIDRHISDPGRTTAPAQASKRDRAPSNADSRALKAH
jgi:hypothetical protein